MMKTTGVGNTIDYRVLSLGKIERNRNLKRNDAEMVELTIAGIILFLIAFNSQQVIQHKLLIHVCKTLWPHVLHECWWRSSRTLDGNCHGIFLEASTVKIKNALQAEVRLTVVKFRRTLGHIL